MPGQTCQLGWHQRSDSWFGTRSDRQCSKCVSECVFLCVWCYLSRVGGMARLGKEEMLGPSRLILRPPSLTVAGHITASCCGHGTAASEARWRARTLAPGSAFTMCVWARVVFNQPYEESKKSWQLLSRRGPTTQAVSYTIYHPSSD